MIIILEEEIGTTELSEQVAWYFEVADFDLPSGMLESIFTAAGQLLGSNGNSSPAIIPAPSATGYFLRSDGSTVKMGWQSVDLSQLVQTAVKTAAYTAINNDHVLVNASGASADFEVTLPASPLVGYKVRVSMVAKHATWKVTINRNAQLVMGLTTTGRLSLVNEGDSVYFEYTGATLGWVAIFSTKVPAKVSTVTSASTITPNADVTDIYTVTALAVAPTFAAPSGVPLEGQKLILRIKDNGTARALTWNAIYRAMGTALPTTTVLSKTLYLGFVYNFTDSKWDLIASAQEA